MADNEFTNISVANRVTVGQLGLTRAVLTDTVKGKKKAVPVAIMLCQIRKYSEKPNKENPENIDTKFEGHFEGTNMLTGEKLSGAACYLPGVATGMLKNEVDGAGEGGVVMAALTITVEADPSPKSATGYKFGAVFHGDKSTQVDPFAALRKAVPLAIAAK